MSSKTRKSLIVSHWNANELKEARSHAIETLTGTSYALQHLVTPIRMFIVNQGGSFAILPTGSKDGWDEDYEFCTRLETIKKNLNSLKMEYVDVYFGNEMKIADNRPYFNEFSNYQ